MLNKSELGQLLMIGLAGPSLQPDEIRFLKRVQPAGVTYFRRNVESPKQLRSLSKQLLKLLDRPPLIAIDQEGGRVARLTAPFTEFPGNDFLGRCFLKSNEPWLAVGQARIMARELKAIGVNYNFTPVADIDSNPRNPIIGSRSFGKDPKRVAALVAATVQAYRREHVVSCAKHFPGHGDTASDSHKVLPVVRALRETIEKRELIPFRAAIAAGVPTMMTAHVIYPHLDAKRPATLSPTILQGILRKKLGFKGVIVSDDLEMKAIAAHGMVDEAGIAAMHAGVDLLLVCKSLERSDDVYASLLKHWEGDGRFRKLGRTSVSRVLSMKQRYLTWMADEWFPLPGKNGWPEHRKVADRIRTAGSAKVL